MTKLDIILSAVTLIIMGFTFYFSYKYLSDKLKKVGHKAVSFADEARYNRMLDQIMFTLQTELHASNVFLARLHNNGHWNNGRSMKKFTIMMEKLSGTSPSIQQDYKDVLCSRYPEAMDFLLFYHTYQQADICLCKDANIRRDFLTKYGYASLYFFLIEQANGDQTEEAFIGILYKEPHVLCREHADLVKSRRFSILGLLNMVEPKVVTNI